MSDIERDEHLRAALRHAPDAALAAPPDLSAQILAAAHRATAERAPAAAAPRRRWWAPQTPWRLGASGAFATVLLAGVVGLVWRGETPGPATEAAYEVAANAPAPTPVPAPAPLPPPAAAPAVVAEAVKPAPPPKALRKQEAEQRHDAMAARQRSAQEKDMARDDARRAAPLKEEAARAESRVVANQVSAAPPPPAAPFIPAPTPAPAVLAGAETAPAAAARKPLAADASREGLLGRAAPALMAAPRPSGPWMDALAAGSAVQWKVDGEPRAPTSSWLYALAEQTQGRWRPAANGRPGAGDSTVSWQRGDAVLGRLWLGDERALWCDAQGRCEEAALAVEVGSVLRKGLAR